MKAVQMNGRPEILEFKNYERIDEIVLFNRIMDELKENPKIEVGKKEIGPSEDFYHCSIEKIPFTLIYDINYGPSIYSDNQTAIKKLIEYFD